MPTLNWIGKEKVVNHHLEVPYRVLEHKYTFRAAGNNGECPIGPSGNMIIHGDNLEALKALLPEYEGRVKCIYIDPPYNTGNEGWVYNDNVNHPKIQKWLGEVVGKQEEDFTRHDKWLCMMYPRLRLLQRLLSEDGAIFISIDDNEQAHLKMVCDEIFGARNFLANIAWEKRYTRSNNAKMFYSLKDSILVYRKSDTLCEIKEARTEKADANYSNPDNDPRGAWMTSSYVNPATKEKRPNLVYEIISPDNRTITHPTHAWKYSKEEYEKHRAENRLWWGNDGTAIYPRLKNYLSEMPGMVPVDLWHYQDTGTTDEGGTILKQIFDTLPFDTPKPPTLIERIIKMFPDKNSIILDSFAGSGTTAHAVLNLNKKDGGNRKFILVEMEDYADSITAERVRRVMNGYADTEGTGGSFDFYELGKTLFNADGTLNETVGEDRIREYVFYTETKQHLSRKRDDRNRYLLDTWNGVGYYLYYEPNQETAFTYDRLSIIGEKAERYIVYADTCTIDKDYLTEKNIIFRKIPRDIQKF